MWTQNIPKVELHCHLDGSIPLSVIKGLCQKEKIAIPGSEKAFRKLVEADENCKSLCEYLEAFKLPLSCLATEESFYEAAYGEALEASKEGVLYQELRFSPLLSEKPGLSSESIIEAAIEGLVRAKAECGIHVELLLCGMRHFTEAQNFRILELTKKYLSWGVCGADLAGDEAAFANEKFLSYFKRASAMDIPFTVHAGECRRAKNIEIAVLEGARRIGHGIAMSGNEQLLEILCKKNIGVELCPNSNVQTKAVSSWQDYPFREFLERGIKISINTDNRTVTNTTITNELNVLKEKFALTIEEAAAIMKQAMETSFAEESLKKDIIKKLSSD